MVRPPVRSAVEADGVTGRRALSEVILTPTTAGLLPVAGIFKALLRRWKVWSHYSPPGQPEYNGAIEASIGALKKRMQYVAEQRGPGESWTSADLEAARELVNSTMRPRGWKVGKSHRAIAHRGPYLALP
jgi:hypothetical protein